MENWQPGDRGVCIDDNWLKYGIEARFVGRRYPRRGRTYLVKAVRVAPTPFAGTNRQEKYLALVGMDPDMYFASPHFRKLGPDELEAERKRSIQNDILEDVKQLSAAYKPTHGGYLG